jgi:tetratricopeptide (TPR) repeat protein
MLQKEPQRGELYAARAEVFARMGQWADSIADLKHAIALSPSSPNYRFQMAALVLDGGEAGSYERYRREALSRFVDPDDPTLAAQVAEMSLMRAVEGTELEAAAKLADRGASAEYFDLGLVQRQLAKSLADYRAGRFESAIQWSERVLASAKKRDLIGWTHERERNRSAAALFVQAMAHHQLKHTDASKVSFAGGAEIVQARFPEVDGAEMGREWAQMLIARNLFREAQALVQPASASGLRRAQLFRAN